MLHFDDALIERCLSRVNNQFVEPTVLLSRLFPLIGLDNACSRSSVSSSSLKPLNSGVAPRLTVESFNFPGLIHAALDEAVVRPLDWRVVDVAVRADSAKLPGPSCLDLEA